MGLPRQKWHAQPFHIAAAVKIATRIRGKRSIHDLLLGKQGCRGKIGFASLEDAPQAEGHEDGTLDQRKRLRVKTPDTRAYT